jgi:predicted O-methyltransferase YrrM
MRLKKFKQHAWELLLSSPDSYINKKAIHITRQLEYYEWKKRLESAKIPKAEEIFTYTRPQELKTLYELALNCPQGAFALEIGSHLGASSCYIAAALAQIGGHLFCVDTWNNETMIEGQQDTFAQFRDNTQGVQQCITPVRKWSHQLDERDIKHPLSLIFIDGDHRYDAVKHDFTLTQQWLAQDGIIVFHDFSNPDYEGVSRVVGEALASGEWVLLGKVDTLAWIKRVQWFNPSWLSEN